MSPRRRSTIRQSGMGQPGAVWEGSWSGNVVGVEVDGTQALGGALSLLEQRIIDLRLRDGIEDLALDEDLGLAVAGGDAEVGRERL